MDPEQKCDQAEFPGTVTFGWVTIPSLLPGVRERPPPQVLPVHCARQGQSWRGALPGSPGQSWGSDTDRRSTGVTLGLQSQLRRQTQAQTATELMAQRTRSPGLGVSYLYWA